MRHGLLLGFLALLLVGLIVLNRAVSAWRYALTGEPGTLLYTAAFDGFEDEWNLLGRRLEPIIANGVMRFEVNDIDLSPYQTTKPLFADFDLTIEARAVDGPENNGFGVVFRLQDAENFYSFLISSDGYYRITRRLNGEEKELSAWIASPAIRTGIGETNWLRVAALGDRFWFYVNDQQLQMCVPNNPEGQSTYFGGECLDGNMVDVLIDSTFASGQLGPVVLTLNEPGVVVEFDNLIVFAPRPTPTELDAEARS